MCTTCAINRYKKEILEMRAWIADCTWADLEDVAELSDAAVIDGIERHWHGGLDDFLLNCADFC